MRFILFLSLVFISCTEIIEWTAEIKNCSFEFIVDDCEYSIPSGSCTKKYLFMKNLDNSAVNYSFICEQSENVFAGEIISGRYMVVYYFLVSKNVGDELKFYADAYSVQEINLYSDRENKKIIESKKIIVAPAKIYSDTTGLKVDFDSSYDFFQIYGISAFSIKHNGKNKSYDKRDGYNYFFENVGLPGNKLLVNLSYSIKNCYDKEFLLSNGIKITTTRLENLNIFNQTE